MNTCIRLDGYKRNGYVHERYISCILPTLRAYMCIYKCSTYTLNIITLQCLTYPWKLMVHSCSTFTSSTDTSELSIVVLVVATICIEIDICIQQLRQ